MDDNHSLVPLSSNELVKANNSISITEKLLNIKSKCIIQININYEISIMNCVMLENYEMFSIEIIDEKFIEGDNGPDKFEFYHSSYYFLKHVNYITGEVFKELNICGVFYPQHDVLILKYDKNSNLIYFSYSAYDICDENHTLVSSELFVVNSLTFNVEKNIINYDDPISNIILNDKENEILIEYEKKMIVYNSKNLTSKSIYNFETYNLHSENTFYKSLGLFALDSDLNKIINFNSYSYLIEIQHYINNNITLLSKIKANKDYFRNDIDYCEENKLLTFNYKDTINIYDLRKNQIVNSIQNIEYDLLKSIKYSNQGIFLSLIYGNELLIYETNSYTLIDKIGYETREDSFVKLEYSMDDRYILMMIKDYRWDLELPTSLFFEILK